MSKSEQAETTAPTVSTQILFDPARNKVWTVNPDSDTVSRLDAGSLSKDLEIAVGVKPSSLALKPDGSALWVVCEGSSELWSLNPATGAVLGKINLGYGYGPVGVAFAPNGSAAFIALGGAEGLLKLNPSTLAVQANLDLGAPPSSAGG
jgi:DNA-binding beta-propeller fold protein YncE